LSEHPADPDPVRQNLAEARRLLASGIAPDDLPAGPRETWLDIEAIKAGVRMPAAVGDTARAAPPNVISFADRRAKLPKGL
jgi:hypothetical protein